MHEVIEQKGAEIEALCRTLGIRRLDLFGSAVAGSFDPWWLVLTGLALGYRDRTTPACSDIDVLVEFDSRPGSITSGRTSV